MPRKDKKEGKHKQDAASPAAEAPASSGPLIPSKRGCHLLIRVTPGAERDALDGIREGRLRVKVSAPPEDGKANAAVLKLLSKKLGIPAAALEIKSGASGREKTILIRGYEPDEVPLDSA